MSTKEETKKTNLESTVDYSDVDNDKCSSSSSGSGEEEEEEEEDDTKKKKKKTCVDCGTNTTPLWRGGPSGPKVTIFISLCNACGIKSRKRRQAALGIKQEDTKIKNKSNHDHGLENQKSIKNKTEDHQGNVKNMIKKKTHLESYNRSYNKKKSAKRISRFLELGFKVPAMKRSTVERKKMLWKKLGEEEKAALLLMTLSST
ncbi:unnamed protein product [Cochlearia groenlandica]